MKKDQNFVERITPWTKNFESGYAPHISRYEFAKDILSSRQIKNKILDVGCGTGYGTAYLSDYFYGKIVGIDIDKKAIEFAERNFASSNCEFKLMDGQSLIFYNEKFNAIVALEVIEHVSNPEQLLREIKKILTRRGILIISTPNKEISSQGEKKPKSPYHKKEYTQEEFEKILKTYFSKVTIFGQHYSNSYIERKNISNLVRNLITDKNSYYLHIFRKFIPKILRELIPDIIRKPVGQKIYQLGKNKYKNINSLNLDTFLAPSPPDFEINRFKLNKSDVLIAICI